MLDIMQKLREKQVIHKDSFADMNGKSERQVRKAMQMLSGDKENPIVFVPIKGAVSGLYKNADVCTEEEIQHYYLTLRAHVRTIYFDRLLPIRRYLTDKQQEELYAHLDIFSDFDKEEKE